MKTQILKAAGAVLVFTANQFVQAQPVISNSYFLNAIGHTIAGDTYYAAAGQGAAVQALADLTGTNKTWNFAALNFDPTPSSYSTEYVALPATLLGSDDPAFANATFAIRDVTGNEESVGYYSVSATEYSWLGYYTNDGLVTDAFVYNDPFLQMVFPLQYGSSWEGHGVITEETGDPPPFDTIDIDFTRTANVTGWGTLMTPAGNVQVLRLEWTMTVTSLGFPLGHASSIDFISDQGLTASIDPETLEATYSLDTAGNTAAERLPSGVPDEFHLYDNYPNPFNPSTTIRFDLPETAFVRLAVYDALGREVDVLAAESMPSGAYEYVWNAGSRPSGIYFVRLEAGSFARTGTMILMK